MPAKTFLRRVASHPLLHERYLAQVNNFADRFNDQTLLIDLCNDESSILSEVLRNSTKQLIVLVWLESYENTALSKHLITQLEFYGVQVDYHGYYHNDYDFFATVPDLVEPTMPKIGDKLFQSYNRRTSPWHRQQLHQMLLEHQLDKFGIISWGNVPLDVSTLGDTNYYLTVINETSIGGAKVTRRFIYKNKGIFLTEKTWKPIIGLRPFMLNGDPKVIDYLEAQGFDTFPELRPQGHNSVRALHESIVETLTMLSALSQEELQQRYLEDWLPRCQKNRQLYLDYRNRMLAAFTNKR